MGGFVFEAGTGIAPVHRGFADPRLTAWLSGHVVKE